MEEPQTITEDVRQVLQSADGWLTASEIFERCELAEHKKEVWSRLANMRRDREVIGSRDMDVTRYRLLDRPPAAQTSDVPKDTEHGDEVDATVGGSEQGGSGDSDRAAEYAADGPPSVLQWRVYPTETTFRLIHQDPDGIALTSDGRLQLRFGCVGYEFSREATDRIAGFLGVFEDGIRRRLDDERSVPAPLTGLPVEGEQ